MTTGGPTLRIALVSMHTSPVDSPGSGDVGGMNVVVRHAAEELGRLGHTVEIFTRRSDPDGPDVVDHAPGVSVHFLPAGPPRPATKTEQEGFLEPFTAELARHGPWDVIHSHHWFSGVCALPIARDRQVPHAQSFHSVAADPTSSLSDGERPEGPGRAPAELHLAAESDAVIAVSRAEADTVLARLGARPEKVVVVPPGVDTDQFRPGRQSLVGARPILLAAARLEPLKGLDLAIRAVAGIPAERRPLLVVAGAPTAGHEGYGDKLRDLARSLGVADDVRLAGPVTRDELAHRMRGADAVVVPSHSETYGLVALEAAASQTPVLAADVGGLREAVLDGVTGLLIADRAPSVWTAEIESLLADADRAAAWGRAGREHALHHTWQRTAAGWLAVYRNLLTEGPAGLSE